MNLKRYVTMVFCAMTFYVYGQKTTLDPVITPALFQPSTTITVKYDVTGTALASLTDAYAWVWIPGKNIDAKYNFNPASSNATTSNAKFVKSTDAGHTYFTITFKPSDFFSASIATETQMGILLKGNDWSNGQTTDHLADFWDGSFQLKITSPTAQPLFVNNGDDITIQAETPVAADYDLFVNNVKVNEQDATLTYSYVHHVTETSGSTTVKLTATSGGKSSEDSFQYIISTNSPTVARPAGIIPGINYKNGDNTTVTLCLWAPGKTSVYALGDFSDWTVKPENLLNKDGEFFWIQINGLTSGQEYAFQYLVDETLYVADPYADKILDPDDQYIPASTYPNLKAFPQAALKSDWYFNRLAVLQTGQTPFNWQVTDFEKPAKEKLVIYELLVRDFFADGSRNYQNLIDTLSYFKHLGVNAIELMPIMEFNGNDSWGYNPTFEFAPDKYYGTREKFKEFIDAAHQQGIAVILDIALNHQDLPNPYVLMDFNFSTYKPNPTNKWFNVDATHPFSVFYDMNHESPYTQAYVDTITYHWLHDYKVDGFRFDLAKGFTQKNNPTNVDAWSAYDASRVAIMKRMADKIWSYSPNAYVILEYFAANTEEKELAEYRADEGKGMMTWGNLNYAYNQTSMGFASGSDFSGIASSSRGWTTKGLVGYMESHDEERLMYKNITYGATQGTYNVKDLGTALSRMKAINTMFYTIPGPKMLWEFGELGYDFSINTCADLTINNNCRITAKPVKWDYLDNGARKVLFNHTAEIIKLRETYPVFTTGDVTFAGNATLLKQITIKSNPYTATPANANEMNVQVVANFDLVKQAVPVTFPHTGTWYDYYSDGAALIVNTNPTSITLNPGEYHLYTDVQITPSVVTANEESIETLVDVYPNPARTTLTVKVPGKRVTGLSMLSTQGGHVVPARLGNDTWDVQHIARGLYILEIQTSQGTIHKKILKE